MKFAIFAGTLIEELTGLQKKLIERGHHVDIFPHENITMEQLSLGTLARQLSEYDLVYYRTGLGSAGRTILGKQLYVFLQTVFINPCFYTQPWCQNKVWQLHVARALHLPIPGTILKRHHSFDVVAQSLGVPFIVKASEGIQGKEVRLVTTHEEFKRAHEEMQKDLIYQKHIHNDGDYRVFVLGNRVHAMFKRVPAEGSFRANISQGGRGELVEDPDLRDQLSALALTISQNMNADIAGVDVIRDVHTGQLYLLEININPGWKGLDDALRMDTTEAVAVYFEERVQETKPK